MGSAMAGGRGVMRTAALAAAQLVFAAGLCAAQHAAPVARLTGTVVDSSGVPIALAAVAVLPHRALRAVTDDSGRFAIEGVPVGRVELAIRRLGYAPETVTVALVAGASQPVRLTLQASAFALQAVTITDSEPDPWMRIFERRRRAGRGYFITRKDIERSHAQTTIDLLRRVPGVLIATGRWGPVVLLERGGVGGTPCSPQVFVHLMAHEGPVDDFSPDDIEAMEIYTGISTVPVELQTARAHTCGAIVIWTRDPDGDTVGR